MNSASHRSPSPATVESLHAAELRLVKLEERLEALTDKFKDYRESQEKIKEKDASSLKLQAEEYERRLTDLNNSHETAIRVQEKQVRQETFDRFEGEMRDWREATRKRLDLQEGRDSGKAAIWAAVAALIALLVSIASLVVRLNAPRAIADLLLPVLMWLI